MEKNELRTTRARRGKVARLPREIREKLNVRLANGQPARRILRWLHGQQEVKKILAREFEGAALTPQNLSEWRKGGFREWQDQQEAVGRVKDVLEDAKELRQAADGELSDHLGTVLAARYAVELSGWNGEVSEEMKEKMQVLNGMCHNIVKLRQCEISRAAGKLKRDQYELERDKTEEEVMDAFQRWTDHEAVWMARCKDEMTPRKRRPRLYELFDPAPDGSEAEEQNPS